MTRCCGTTSSVCPILRTTRAVLLPPPSSDPRLRAGRDRPNPPLARGGHAAPSEHPTPNAEGPTPPYAALEKLPFPRAFRLDTKRSPTWSEIVTELGRHLPM